MAAPSNFTKRQNLLLLYILIGMPSMLATAHPLHVFVLICKMVYYQRHIV